MRLIVLSCLVAVVVVIHTWFLFGDNFLHRALNLQCIHRTNAHMTVCARNGLCGGGNNDKKAVGFVLLFCSSAWTNKYYDINDENNCKSLEMFYVLFAHDLHFWYIILLQTENNNRLSHHAPHADDWKSNFHLNVQILHLLDGSACLRNNKIIVCIACPAMAIFNFHYFIAFRDT